MSGIKKLHTIFRVSIFVVLYSPVSEFDFLGVFYTKFLSA